tara:strand:- start:225 stop:2672 length:2448 start_codon:yes stop_codon:yes gene_type:complete
MKKALILLFYFPIVALSQNIFIPDPNFKANLVSNSLINTNGDSEIQITEANIFSGSIDCSFSNIYDLTGIEHFTALTYLSCRNNQITSLDLSQNIALEELYCYNNYIIDLDLSQNINLYRLHCANNYLRRLNVQNGNNTNFAQFNVTDNIELGCIKVDDVIWSSNFWNLAGTYSYFSDITCVNEMTYVPDDNFEQELIDLGYGHYLDDSIPTFHMNSITILGVQNLGISDLTGIEDCISLTQLYFNNNSIGPNNTISGVLDLSNSVNIEKVFGGGSVGGNSITNIIFNNDDNYTLTQLYLGGNPISNIDLTKLHALEILSLPDAPLNSLDLSSNTMLTELSFGLYSYEEYMGLTNTLSDTIPISNIDLSSNTLLTTLRFWNTQITTLDISSLSNLITLDVRNNLLNSINTNGALNLQYFTCFNNQLTSLDLSTNNNLYNLQCFDNQLTSLDLSNNLLLNYLDCSNNQLTSLDISGNTLGLFYSSNPPSGWANTPQNSLDNPDLYCIDVDSAFMFANPWTVINSVLVTDTFSNFSTDCSQAFGCIDTNACNYNPISIYSDESCVYPSVNQQAISICDGEYITVGNSTYGITGNYTDTLVNFNGCDSVVFTDLNILPSLVWQWDTLICEGENIIIGNSVYDSTGNYIDTLVSSNGCDSIVYTYVNITSLYNYEQSFSICEGENVIVGNNVYDVAGFYIDTLASSNGCDSVEVYTDVSINLQTFSFDTIFTKSSINWNNQVLSEPGDYSIVLMNSAGCDSITNLNLNFDSPSEIFDFSNTKKLIYIGDVLGRKEKGTKNQLLFYIYDDGTVEKRIIIE